MEISIKINRDEFSQKIGEYIINYIIMQDEHFESNKTFLNCVTETDGRINFNFGIVEIGAELLTVKAEELIEYIRYEFPSVQKHENALKKYWYLEYNFGNGSDTSHQFIFPVLYDLETFDVFIKYQADVVVSNILAIDIYKRMADYAEDKVNKLSDLSTDTSDGFETDGSIIS